MPGFATKMLPVVLLVCFKVCHITASCPENEEPGFCNGAAYFPQLYCGSVYLTVEKWTCRKKNKERCVCTAPLHRTEDGRCVRENECGGAAKEVHPKPEPPAKGSKDSTYEIPEGLMPTSEDFNNVLKFIQSEKTMYLLMGISSDLPYILRKYDICLRSAYITHFDSGAFRTLSSYKGVQLIGAPITMTTKQGLAEFIVEDPQNGQLQVTVKLDGTEIPTQSSDAHLQGTFLVIDVKDECLLLAYGSGIIEMRCMLWGFDPAIIEKTSCYQKMVAHCRRDMEDLLRQDGPCTSTKPQQKETTDDHTLTEANGAVAKAVNKPISTDLVIQFLRNHGKIFLQMIDKDDWMRTDCECVMSAFLAATSTGSQRNLQCYLYTEMLNPQGDKKTIPDKLMGKIEQNVEFRVSTQGDVTTVILKPILGVDPIEEPSRNFISSCLVIEANSQCLLLSYGQADNGKQKCLLLGLSNNNVDTTTECYKKLELCTADMYDLTESNAPCDHYQEK